jgi:hypothetical protein
LLEIVGVWGRAELACMGPRVVVGGNAQECEVELVIVKRMTEEVQARV